MKRTPRLGVLVGQQRQHFSRHPERVAVLTLAGFRGQIRTRTHFSRRRRVSRDFNLRRFFDVLDLYLNLWRLPARGDLGLHLRRLDRSLR